MKKRKNATGDQAARDRSAKRAAGQQKLVGFLSRPLLLEESGPPRVLSHLLAIISLLVVTGIVGAGVTEITETAMTHGQIMPSGSVRLVEHLEGGIVSDILVEEGQVVRRNDVLLRLRNVDAVAELERLRAQEAALALRAERLRSFVLDRPPDFSAGEAHPALVADQKAILDIQVEARASQRQVLLSRIDQRRLELEALDEQQRSVEEQLEITGRETSMRRRLVEKGLDSEVNFLDVERRLAQVRGERLGILGQISSTREALHEAESSLVELDATLRNDALKEMGEVTAELAEVRESVARLEDKVDRLEVTAPLDGIVKGLIQNTVGGVIAPGEAILEIVPRGETLVAEVRVEPRDIGHIRVGQAVKIRISAYDVVRFGTLKGTLRQVSASTFQDEEGRPYYKAIVGLERGYLGSSPHHNLLLPGMVVDADINTGTKTLLQYLLKPVYRAFDSAFHER